MIDLLSEEHVAEIIEQRKKVFSLNYEFYVLTPLNHAFRFWGDGDVCILSKDFWATYQPEVLKLYCAEYDYTTNYISDPTTRKHLYELFISDPGCLFFQDWKEIRQELRNRELV